MEFFYQNRNKIMSNSIRDYLLAGIAKQAGVQTLEAELVTAREGMYTCGVKAAIVSEDKQAFLDAAEKLMADFRRNLRDIATKHNMPQAKDTHGELKTDEDGNAIYTVPSSLSSVKSVCSKAFDAGINFGTIDKPASFGAIRTALKAARDADSGEPSEDTVVLTGDDKRRADGREVLAAIGDSLDGYSGKALTAILKLIKALAKYDAPVADDKAAQKVA